MSVGEVDVDRFVLMMFLVGPESLTGLGRRVGGRAESAIITVECGGVLFEKVPPAHATHLH